MYGKYGNYDQTYDNVENVYSNNINTGNQNNEEIQQQIMKQKFAQEHSNMQNINDPQNNGNIKQENDSSIENNMNNISLEDNNNQVDNTNLNNGIINNDSSTAVIPNEKSSLYLINELSKYNKITHQYTLTDEKGPAHKKVFSVSLKLGEEEFTSTGASIRKAQHAAATEGLSQTSYAKPVLKWKKNQTNKTVGNMNPSLTPTVELNSLAMKQGKNVTYKIISSNNPYRHPNHFFHHNNYPNNCQGNKDLNNGKNFDPTFSRVEMEVEVDGVVYSGHGTWKKQAKNACAAAALVHLKHAAELNTAASNGDVDNPANNAETSNNKSHVNNSEICQVYKMANGRQMSVNFTVTKESGPAHMKAYQTTCTCGDIKVDGMGNSKKDSKKKSAENMLEALKQLPPLPPSAVKPRKLHKKPYTKSKTNNSKAKLQKANPDLREGFHPISRLYQIQQAKKEAEPVYKVLKQEVKSRNKKYLVEVAVGDQTCTAWSSKIKTARLLATENMLQLLGYAKPPSNAFNEDPLTANNGIDKKLTLIDKNIESLAAESMSACAVDQLQYIGQKLGFLIHFRDFPMNTEDGTFATLVSLTTIPTLHCHGEGASLEESQKNAASNSIQQLSEFVAHMKVSLVPQTPPQDTTDAALFEVKHEG